MHYFVWQQPRPRFPFAFREEFVKLGLKYFSHIRCQGGARGCGVRRETEWEDLGNTW